MGWKFRWVSSFDIDFNSDFHVSFMPEEQKKGQVFYNFATRPFECEELPGISVFCKDEGGDVFHTYSTCTGRRGGSSGMHSSGMHSPGALDGMALMYLLVAVFHSAPWLTLLAVRRGRSHARVARPGPRAPPDAVMCCFTPRAAGRARPSRRPDHDAAYLWLATTL